MDRELSQGNLQKVVATLRSPSLSISQRLNSVRVLYTALVRLKKNNRVELNQLLREQILYIIINEDKIIDLYKRQVIRTECFIMLANLLNSDALYKDVVENIMQIEGSSESDDGSSLDIVENNSISYSNVTENSSPRIRNKSSLTGGGVAASPAKRRTPLKNLNHDNGFMSPPSNQRASTVNAKVSFEGLDPMPLERHTVSAGGEVAASPAKRRTPLKNLNHDNGFMSPPSNQRVSTVNAQSTVDPSTLIGTYKKQHRPGFYHRLDENALIKSVVGSTVKKTSKRSLRRQAVFFNDKCQKENFVPGVDPFNYFEIDKKLGYQKSRMWFPVSRVYVDNNLIPSKRPISLESDTIVKEFMQMRALASYVGDLVMPYNKLNTASSSGVGGISNRMKGVWDGRKYMQGMKEAIRMWTPLLGTILPPWIKNTHEYTRTLAGEAVVGCINHSIENPYLETVRAPTSDNSTNNPEQVQLEHKIVLTTKTLRKLMNKERQLVEETSKSIREMIKDRVSELDIGGFHQNITAKFVETQNTIHDEMQTIDKLMKETIKLQYSTLPTKYLCIVEGKNVHVRETMMKMVNKFCNLRRLNYIAGAFGTWKICLVKFQYDSRRKQYAQYTSCHLIVSWMNYQKIKHIDVYITRWKLHVKTLIFNERNKYVIPIQCMYRKWRGRKHLLNLHFAGVYNGPLADIYMAKDRGNKVKFKIPSLIREQRRAVWYAAVPLQAIWRGRSLYMEYWTKRRKIALINKICRMWPKYLQYRYFLHIVIRTQTWIRRYPLVRLLRLWKKTIVIIQRYVRKYICMCRISRVYEEKYRQSEKHLCPPIFIQREWRRRRAIKHTKKKVAILEKKLWAALMVQRRYYRIRDAFHTFFLMSAYRARELEDSRLEKLSYTMGYSKARIKIINLYKEHFKLRVVPRIIQLQSWYRTIFCGNILQRMKRERWASRKLRCYIKIRIKRRNIMARKIQNCWWNFKPGNRRVHIRMRAKLQDMVTFAAIAKIRYHNASIIQAIVKGIWTRRWIIRYKAASAIQHLVKKWLRRTRWVTMKKKHIMKGIQVFVKAQIVHGRNKIARMLCQQHSIILIKPQSVIRGWLLRRKFYASKCAAYKYGVAVIKVQRFIRKSGAMRKAVNELMALRRIEMNPFNVYTALHTLFCNGFVSIIKNRYNPHDISAGMRLPTLLYRLGYAQISPMFVYRNKYNCLSDLIGVTVKDLIAIFSKWRLEATTKDLTQSSDEKKKVKDLKNKAAVSAKEKLNDKKQNIGQDVPIELFKTLLLLSRLDNLRLKPITAIEKDALDSIVSVQDLYTPDEFEKVFVKLFSKKFGTSLRARALGFAQKLKTMCWRDYNNYKSIVGKHFVTIAQIKVAIAKANESKAVGDALGEVIGNFPRLVDEFKYDKERIAEVVVAAQQLVDMIIRNVPDGTIFKIADDCNRKVSSFRRKFSFSVGHQRHRVVHDDVDRADNLSSVVNIDDWVHLPYKGPTEKEYIDLEMNLSVCKLFFKECINVLYGANHGIQLLKDTWKLGAMKRFASKEKEVRFLQNAHDEYMKSFTTNNVYKIWFKDRQREAINNKLNALLLEMQEKKVAIEHVLHTIPRYGWTKVSSDNTKDAGTSDEFEWINNATYESSKIMPTYTYEEHLVLFKLQKPAKRMIERLRIRKKLREEERLKKLAMADEIAAKMNKFSFRHVKINIKVTDDSAVNLLGITSDNISDCSNPTFSDDAQKETSMLFESMIPFRARLKPSPQLNSGKWLLMKCEKTYEIVVAYNVKYDKKDYAFRCDVKTCKGKVYSNVSQNELFDMNYVEGDIVEAKERGTVFFYLATIVAVKPSPFKLGDYVYTVSFHTGKLQELMTRDSLRPSKILFSTFLHLRNFHTSIIEKSRKRSSHFKTLRNARMMCIEGKVKSLSKIFAKNWTLIDAGELVESQKDGAKKRSSDSKVLKAKSYRKFSDMAASCCALKSLEFKVGINMEYIRGSLRYGWKAYPLNEEKTVIEYRKLGVIGVSEVMPNAPTYDSIEHFHANKIQSMWKMKKTKERLANALFSENLDVIALNCINEYQRIAYIGYKLEGVTCMQYLRRSGYGEIATVIETYLMKNAPESLLDLRIDEVANTQLDKFVSLGILQYAHIKQLQEFQKWWKFTPKAIRTHKLSFLNYFNGPTDTRTIQQCIKESEQLITDTFLKSYPSSISRTKSAIEAIVNNGSQPITHAQLDAYLKKYDNKAELARENINELINIPTLPTHTEQIQAYNYILRQCKRIRVLVANINLTLIKGVIVGCLQKAEDVLAMGDRSAGKIGKENLGQLASKASLLLRSELLAFILDVSKACIKIQTKIRGFTKKVIYSRHKSLRRVSAIKIQQAARCRYARRLCIELRKQQNAVWEQLWDTKRNVMYYYNWLTEESKFVEPRDIFRPLVRDRRSSRLVQAWPNLRILDTDFSKVTHDMSVCKICQFRKTVRKCKDCDTHNITPFCFPCYQKSHADEGNIHRFDDVEGENQAVTKTLRCSICNQVATRKCLGLFDDRQIDTICSDLLKSRISNWPKVLAQSNIAGEKKVQVILDNLNAIDNVSRDGNPYWSDETFVFSYLQQIKTILERFRAECDECFCMECYEVVHTGGKRSLHRWIGFQPNAVVCNVCARSPATIRCNYCTENSCYCPFCYKVFHSKGKKRKHTHSVIIEDMKNAADVFCDMCDRRPAQIPCENEKCNFFGCDSCYECDHKRSCRWNETEHKIPKQTAEQR